jgi:hypothetical protein
MKLVHFDIYMAKGDYIIVWRCAPWRQNSFDWFSRVDLGTRYVTVCVLQEGVGGKLSAVFLQPIQNRGLYRTEEWFYKEPCFPIQASMTLKSKVNAEYAKHTNDPVLSSLKMEGIRLLFFFIHLTFKNLASYIWDGRTATLQMLHFVYIFSTNISTEYFKHAAHSPFFSSKCR